jgi:hypothetical protein
MSENEKNSAKNNGSDEKKENNMKSSPKTTESNFGELGRAACREVYNVIGWLSGDTKAKKAGAGTAAAGAVYGAVTGDLLGGGLAVGAGLGLRKNDWTKKAVAWLDSKLNPKDKEAVKDKVDEHNPVAINKGLLPLITAELGDVDLGDVKIMIELAKKKQETGEELDGNDKLALIAGTLLAL